MAQHTTRHSTVQQSPGSTSCYSTTAHVKCQGRTGQEGGGKEKRHAPDDDPSQEHAKPRKDEDGGWIQAQTNPEPGTDTGRRKVGRLEGWKEGRGRGARTLATQTDTWCARTCLPSASSASPPRQSPPISDTCTRVGGKRFPRSGRIRPIRVNVPFSPMMRGSVWCNGGRCTSLSTWRRSPVHA